MSLNNFYFIFFWAGVLLVMALLNRGSKTWQKLALLIGSYLFIAVTDIRFCIVMAAVTALVFFIGKAAGGSGDGHRKKLLTACGIGCLILILAFFKYADFFIKQLGEKWGLYGAAVRILLPLGLSYYTFSAIAYLADVYKGKIKAENSFLDFALFLAFFPKVIAGPIARAEDFLPQIKPYAGIRVQGIAAGVQIFVFGLFKKMVLADHLGVFVDDVFRTPAAYGSLTVIWATISYSFQIYLDFSGYSDMAVGVAKTLGIELKPNFNLPYLAADISEFWKRWHISLSSFLQEYIYFPLGGSRKGAARTYINLMCVMAVSGIWHGNGSTFLVWGILHGVTSCVYHALRGYLPKGRLAKIVGIAVNFCLVNFFWIFFRADGLSDAFAVIGRMCTFRQGVEQPYLWSFFAIGLCLAASAYAYKKGGNGYYPVLKLNSVKDWTIFLTFVGLTVMLGYYGNTAFIYGGF